jgi:heme-degrading monooxygenase HmoA
MSSVTMINAFEVPEAAVERFLREWPGDLAFMRTQPGFEAGTLYRARDPGARFAFVNVARWRDEASFAPLGRACGATGASRA